MLSLATIPSHHPETVPALENDTQVLQDRMRKPQRHRLLHGYPLAAAMRPRDAQAPADDDFPWRSARGLLVGVLPHPYCNPTVTGCGFCTFPHEAYNAPDAVKVV